MAMDTRRYQKRQAATGQVDIHTSSIPGLLVLTIGIIIIIVAVILIVAIGVDGPLSGKYLAGPICMAIGGLVVIVGVVVAIRAKQRRKAKKQQRRVSPNGGGGGGGAGRSVVAKGRHASVESSQSTRGGDVHGHGHGGLYSNDPHSHSGVIIQEHA